LSFDAELFYVGAMFHDIGLVEGHRSAHERFDIDGANATRAFLERHGLPEEEITVVWDAIALHTTPQISHYVGGLEDPLAVFSRVGSAGIVCGRGRFSWRPRGSSFKVR
jgi:HD domain